MTKATEKTADVEQAPTSANAQAPSTPGAGVLAAVVGEQNQDVTTERSTDPRDRYFSSDHVVRQLPALEGLSDTQEVEVRKKENEAKNNALRPLGQPL